MPRMPGSIGLQDPNAVRAVPGRQQNNIGAAIADVGQTVFNADLAARRRKQEEEDALDLARARATFSTRMLQEKNGYTIDQDPDYSRWGKKFDANSKKIQASAAELIRNPKIRERFTLETVDDITSGGLDIGNRARGIDRDKTVTEAITGLDDTVALAATADDETANRALERVNDSLAHLRETGLIDPAKEVELRQQYTKRYAAVRIQRDIQADPANTYRNLRGDPGEVYYSKLRVKESGSDDAAKADTSSALGRYQFLKGTWDEVRAKHPELNLTADGRTDPQQQERAIRAFTQDNIEVLKAAGVRVTEATLYMAHFLGAQGAIDMVNADPNANAAQLFPKAASANQSVFFTEDGVARTVGEVFALQTKRFSDQGGPAPDYYRFVDGDDRMRYASAAEGEWAAREKEKTEAAAFTKYQLRQSLADDVAQVEQTGRGQDIDPKTVVDTLGDVDAAKWMDDRQTALDTFKAVGAMESMSMEEIDAHLDELEPREGADNYARAQKVYEKAERRAEKLRKLRIEDPAKAVEDSPIVRRAAEGYDPANPESVQAMARARIAAQQAVGIPAAMQQPVTMAEAKQLIAPIERIIDMQDAQIVSLVGKSNDPAERRRIAKQVRAESEEQIRATVDQIEKTYGPLAPQVLSFAIAESVRDKEIGDLAAGVLRKIVKGEKPTPAELSGIENAADASVAEKAASGTLPKPEKRPAVQTPVASRETDIPEGKKPDKFGPFPEPTQDAVSLLIRNPELASRFDALYGPGAAARWLPRE